MISAWLAAVSYAGKTWVFAQLVALINTLIERLRTEVAERQAAERELADALNQREEARTRCGYQVAYAREAAAEAAQLRRGVADVIGMLRAPRAEKADEEALPGLCDTALAELLKVEASDGARMLEELAASEARGEERSQEFCDLYDNIGEALDSGLDECPVAAAKRVRAELLALLAADDASATITVQRDRARASEEKLRGWIEAHAASLDDDALEDQAREARVFLDSVDAQGELLLQELDDARSRTNDAEIALSGVLAREATAIGDALHFAVTLDGLEDNELVYLDNSKTRPLVARVLKTAGVTPKCGETPVVVAPSPVAPAVVTCANCDSPTDRMYALTDDVAAPACGACAEACAAGAAGCTDHCGIPDGVTIETSAPPWPQPGVDPANACLVCGAKGWESWLNLEGKKNAAGMADTTRVVICHAHLLGPLAASSADIRALVVVRRPQIIDAALRACLSTGPKRWFTMAIAVRDTGIKNAATAELDAAELRIGATWDAAGKLCSLAAAPADIATSAPTNWAAAVDARREEFIAAPVVEPPWTPRSVNGGAL